MANEDKIRVLVWKAYGNINLYRLNTLEEHKHIFDCLVSNLKWWGGEYEKRCDKVRSKSGEEFMKIVRELIKILQEDEVGSHEVFEYLEIKYI